jgi:hypothetical protein
MNLDTLLLMAAHKYSQTNYTKLQYKTRTMPY